MWLKLILAGLIIAFCTLLGYFAAGKYRARKNFYAQFHALNERFLSELGYRRKPLPAFLAENNFTGDFHKTVENFSHTRKADVAYSYLSEEEKESANAYFSMLGRGDSRSQLSFFEGERTALSEKKKICESEAKARGELYLKLGLLAGLAFVILIV